MSRFTAFAICLTWAAAVRGAEPQPDLTKLPPVATGPVDFRSDVQPILVRACVSCHGPAKQKGGLRLDEGAAALKGSNSGPVYKPGDSAGSRLIHLVAGVDPE